ncbi:hypothetical protein Plhal304r1_c047g0129381 [Plasmopara halstedii]
MLVASSSSDTSKHWSPYISSPKCQLLNNSVRVIVVLHRMSGRFTGETFATTNDEEGVKVISSMLILSDHNLI